MSEHYQVPEQSEIDKRLIERYQEGFVEAFKKGFSEGTYMVYEKIVSMLKDGKTVEEIENDDLFADFTFSIIAPKLEVPTQNVEILKNYNK